MSARQPQEQLAAAAGRGETVEIRSLDGALRVLDSWVAAYRDLEADFRKLHERCAELEWQARFRADLLAYLDPFLPAGIQDKQARAASPEIYEAVARELTGQAPEARHG